MNTRREITIDTNGLQDIALRGVRRATAFLGLGLKALADGPPKSVTVESGFRIQWFPDPLPDAVAAEIAHEYETWLVGSALKELDLFFSMFLDEVWDWLKLAESHGKPLTADHKPDASFRAKTKVSEKLKLVEAAIGVSSSWSAYFDGYSVARNCLTHNAGVLRLRDCNLDGALELKWRGPDVVVKSPTEEVVLNSRGEMPTQVFGPDAEASFRMTERTHRVEVGKPIQLSRFDLSEMCFSYQLAASDVINGFVATLRDKGIVAKEASEQPVAPEKEAEG